MPVCDDGSVMMHRSNGLAKADNADDDAGPDASGRQFSDCVAKKLIEGTRRDAAASLNWPTVTPSTRKKSRRGMTASGVCPDSEAIDVKTIKATTMTMAKIPTLSSRSWVWAKFTDCLYQCMEEALSKRARKSFGRSMMLLPLDFCCCFVALLLDDDDDDAVGVVVAEGGGREGAVVVVVVDVETAAGDFVVVAETGVFSGERGTSSSSLTSSSPTSRRMIVFA